jgi:hypothetical protein
MLEYCLHTVLDSSHRRDNAGFDFALEERLSLHDIFHYALKLDSSGYDEREDTASSVVESCSDDSSAAEPRGYSLTCGVSRLFRRREEDHFLLNGNGTYRMDEDYNRGAVSRTGFEVVSRVILHDVLHATDACSDADTSASWRRCFVVASLLIRDSLFGLDLCSADRFSRYLRNADTYSLSSLLPSTLRTYSDLVELVAAKKRECYAELERTESGILLDLFLILLGCHWSSGEADPVVAGLLLLAVVTGHHSGRIKDYVDDDSLEHPYLKAVAEADL